MKQPVSQLQRSFVTRLMRTNRVRSMTVTRRAGAVATKCWAVNFCRREDEVRVPKRCNLSRDDVRNTHLSCYLLGVCGADLSFCFAASHSRTMAKTAWCSSTVDLLEYVETFDHGVNYLSEREPNLSWIMTGPARVNAINNTWIGWHKQVCASNKYHLVYPVLCGVTGSTSPDVSNRHEWKRLRRYCTRV